MERLYRNKKDYYNGVTIDSNGEACLVLDDRGLRVDTFSEISCYNCKYFREWDFFCKAYPKGIPDELLYGEEAHREVRNDQRGTTVFEQKK